MTSLKKLSTCCVLAVVALVAFFAGGSRARAQVVVPVILSTDTTACDAYMLDKKGNWKFKMKADRRSEQYLIWDKLILTFDAEYHDGGDQISSGFVAISTDTKPRKVIFYQDLEIKGSKWKYETEVKTDHGPVRLKCHL